MPNYTFKDKETGEETTVWLTMTEHDTYLNDKPHLEQVIGGASIVDPANIGVQRPPDDFSKYVLGKIRDNAPGADKSKFGNRWSIPKEI
jgi:hypothetical protein